jgi:hypothetical protein
MKISAIKKYIGKNVKRKNLRGGYKYYIVLAYSDLCGFKLYEPKTETKLNVPVEIIETQFKIYNTINGNNK